MTYDPERRGDDERIAAIQAMCHDMQVTQKELASDYKLLAQSQYTLTSRVALVEERHNSQQRETAIKLDAMHQLLIDNHKTFVAHDAVETQDRQQMLKQQRSLIIWLIGLVVTGAGAILMVLLERQMA
jgi:phosphomevalonate kinase